MSAALAEQAEREAAAALGLHHAAQQALEEVGRMPGALQGWSLCVRSQQAWGLACGARG